MLRSLEDMGLVRRDAVDHDRRKRFVYPTVRCRRLMTHVARLTLGNGFSELMIRSIFVPERWFSQEISRETLERLLQRFRALRFELGDRVAAWDGTELYTDRDHHDWVRARDLEPAPGLPLSYYVSRL
jgi:hypothetical protein